MIKEPKHFAKLCRQVGVIVLQAQIVEHNLAMYLAASLRLERNAAVEEVHQALAADNKKTIERLLKKTEKDFPLESSLAKRIRHLKEERNWLVHRLQREAPRAIFSEAAAQPVFQRIQRLDKAIISVLIDLDAVGDGLMNKHGFDSEQIKTKAMEKFKEKATKNASDETS